MVPPVAGALPTAPLVSPRRGGWHVPVRAQLRRSGRFRRLVGLGCRRGAPGWPTASGQEERLSLAWSGCGLLRGGASEAKFLGWDEVVEELLERLHREEVR